MKIKFIILIIYISHNILGQSNNCENIKNHLKILDDYSLNLMFDKIDSSKVLLIGETHTNDHSVIYPKLLSKAMSRGFNTIIIELPVSYNLLFELLLKEEKFSNSMASLIAKFAYNKDDFKKTIKAIYEINKIKPIKIVCPDLEHSLVTAGGRIYDILSIHKSTLNTNFLKLYVKLEKTSNQLMTSESEWADIFQEVIALDNLGDFTDSTCLREHYHLFKTIIEATKLNGKITGKNYEFNQRERFMINYLMNIFAINPSTKAIGFFGSTHVQLLGDDIFGTFVKDPFAKLLNATEFCNI